LVPVWVSKNQTPTGSDFSKWKQKSIVLKNWTNFETKFWNPFVCGTGTETFLVYFKIRTGAHLLKS